MSETNLFDSLTDLRRTTVKVALQSGTRFTPIDPITRHALLNPLTRKPEVMTVPMSGTKPIVFEIHPVTANEIMIADAAFTARPPKIYEEQPSPSRVGTVKVQKGYDYEDPEFVAKRQEQAPKRNALLCLYGCPALTTSTPGNTMDDKATKLLAEIPGLIIEWLCNEIETISVLTAVGDEDVASFLAEGSAGTDTKSSKPSSKRSPDGGKSRPSKDSTAPTSTTRSGKRR